MDTRNAVKKTRERKNCSVQSVVKLEACLKCRNLCFSKQISKRIDCKNIKVLKIPMSEATNTSFSAFIYSFSTTLDFYAPPLTLFQSSVTRKRS